jgi:hypothetical protein
LTDASPISFVVVKVPDLKIFYDFTIVVVVVVANVVVVVAAVVAFVAAFVIAFVVVFVNIEVSEVVDVVIVVVVVVVVVVENLACGPYENQIWSPRAVVFEQFEITSACIWQLSLQWGMTV